MTYGDSDDNLTAVKLAAYSDRLSIKPQEALKLYVSCEKGTEYKAETARLICGDENPKAPATTQSSLRWVCPSPFQDGTRKFTPIHA